MYLGVERKAGIIQYSTKSMGRVLLQKLTKKQPFTTVLIFKNNDVF